MLRLIEANLTPAGETHLRDGSPPFFLNGRALNAVLAEGSHFCFQIGAQEIEFMCAILSGGVESSLGRWQGKDQPAKTRIHRFEPENIPKKCTISLGILAIDNNVSAGNHSFLLEIHEPPWRCRR
jgi:hypothetical protein